MFRLQVTIIRQTLQYMDMPCSMLQYGIHIVYICCVEFQTIEILNIEQFIHLNFWWGDQKESIFGKTRWKKKSGKTIIKVVRLLRMIWTGCVSRWRKKAEDRSVWAVILKEVLVKLLGPDANKDMSFVNLPTYDILIIDCEPVSKKQRSYTVL